jgi:hypothetical protein
VPSRSLVLTYFEPDGLATLLAALRGTKLPAGTRVYIGTYGVNPETAAAVHTVPQARYAPMFHIQPGAFWEGRRLSDRPARRLLEHNPRSARLAGPLPSLPLLLRVSTARRVTWGVELGSRFRDALRESATTDTWQLDEIVAECAGPLGKPYRELTRAVLRGLVFGRPVLGDTPYRGLIWWAKTAHVLATRRVSPELASFWRMLNRACLGLIGEEYPEFVGDPRKAARAAAGGQQALLASGPVRRSLGKKYLCGVTPGFHLAPGLGGNTRHLPRAEAERWRAAYLRARAATPAAGFAEFNFRFENNPRPVIRELIRELAEVLSNPLVLVAHARALADHRGRQCARRADVEGELQPPGP